MCRSWLAPSSNALASFFLLHKNLLRWRSSQVADYPNYQGERGGGEATGGWRAAPAGRAVAVVNAPGLGRGVWGVFITTTPTISVMNTSTTISRHPQPLRRKLRLTTVCRATSSPLLTGRPSAQANPSMVSYCTGGQTAASIPPPGAAPLVHWRGKAPRIGARPARWPAKLYHDNDQACHNAGLVPATIGTFSRVADATLG